MPVRTGDFKIEVNRENKTIDMVIIGTFSEEKVQEFVKEYLEKVQSVNASEYTLNVDSTDMDVLTQDMIPSMKESIGLYQQSGFDKMIITIKKNVILKMQLNRILRSTDFGNAEIREV
ncbi:hypothetical protein JOD43_004068 [Pullulanibacillus pueri]|uniref:Uncharacterized protein n=1 Tax=Pullulanibacillus pueri TaxID=1437324 RepID=A0A8J2ZX35_9BACL|nr:hypothetical protein [Pullulanibacillus pueri]MBM7683877.1 hypothetical protein [Pullulanibacillus pueri]GGH84638.1 hypothetical protein GCM10007096_28180 [Pullulanibacillus pueri]